MKNKMKNEKIKKMNVRIFKDYKEFRVRKDKAVNGVSQKFLDKQKRKLEDLNLEDCKCCWNCMDCKNCAENIGCIDCENCIECDYLINRMNCFNLKSAKI